MRTLTITAGLAAAAAALAGCGNLSVGTHHENRSYTAPAGVTTLKIKSHGSRVVVTATDTSTIKVSERLRWTNEKNKPKAKHVTDGGTLTLSSECGNQVIGYSGCGVSYRVQVPRSMPVDINGEDGTIVASGLSGTVRLHSSNGSIDATGLNATAATITSSDGSVRVTGHAGTARLSSENGTIDARGLSGDRLSASTRDGMIRMRGTFPVADLHTDNGSIDGRGLSGDRITAKSRDGSIDLRFGTAPTAVTATTDNGSVRLHLPPGERYAIDASTDNGGKRIDPLIRQDSDAKRHIKLSTRDGAITVFPSP
ncbi:MULTISPECIES: DUF4097 family beta strand repeat-containing protein [Actinomadura]|uniref:Putative adhesin n=1 Tax=Actinomadura madurae TaxID=1993 RepID=A0A1I5XDK9_9ACTN|nr:DUF4097 family beta strand repeat-containing protein [Actinomadura madurae]SFQ30031.1 Putative adhesin [Actinomadura madurae]SPT59042.1 Uncharacterised protein [Actinomadura madurae]